MEKSTAKNIDKGKDKAINFNDPNCSVYGAHKTSNPACKACETNFKDR